MNEIIQTIEAIEGENNISKIDNKINEGLAGMSLLFKLFSQADEDLNNLLINA